MQNVDFYTGNNARNISSSFSNPDPEYFTRMSDSRASDQDRIKKRASRIIFFVISLCIISFTTGLAIGIKFAGGEDRQIVDDTTYEAMGKIKSRVSGLMAAEKDKSSDPGEQFPAAQYPYVLKIGKDHTRNVARDIAAFLSVQGHRVILSKNTDAYRIYVGPYKTLAMAEESLKKVDTYRKYSISGGNTIIKRN